tara:strand:+ start:56827 stop:56985 length:159 start_codon:yes stop_codon:yes gene_type:complete
MRFFIKCDKNIPYTVPEGMCYSTALSSRMGDSAILERDFNRSNLLLLGRLKK